MTIRDKFTSINPILEIHPPVSKLWYMDLAKDIGGKKSNEPLTHDKMGVLYSVLN